jgi:hypothetical protein
MRQQKFYLISRIVAEAIQHGIRIVEHIDTKSDVGSILREIGSLSYQIANEISDYHREIAKSESENESDIPF